VKLRGLDPLAWNAWPILRRRTGRAQAAASHGLELGAGWARSLRSRFWVEDLGLPQRRRGMGEGRRGISPLRSLRSLRVCGFSAEHFCSPPPLDDRIPSGFSEDDRQGASQAPGRCSGLRGAVPGFEAGASQTSACPSWSLGTRVNNLQSFDWGCRLRAARRDRRKPQMHHTNTMP
jgi:hypothetical protein